MSSLGGASQVWLAAEGEATPVLSVFLAFLLSDGAAFFLAAAGLAVSFLAASAAGLRIRAIAGAKLKTADKRTERVRVHVMGDLSNAKAVSGSRDSAGHHFTVKVSERGKFAELGPTMTFTVPDSTAQPLVS